MTVACIIQARLGSTRLPAKVLLPLPTGRTVLEEVIWRCKQIKGVDYVCCATSEAPGNQILLRSIIKGGAVLYIGSETDVLARYAEAASELRADVVMRITADCPLLDPQTCEAVLEGLEKAGADYVSNVWPVRTFPQGWDCEVFTIDALRKADANATDAYDREHVTPWLQRSPTIARATFEGAEDRSHIRWTLDTIEDYVTIWNEFERREREVA